MKDHIPTKILANGALRYGVYDDAGTLVRYEYIKPEDEPSEAGDLLCKATLLDDNTCTLLSLPNTAVPNSALQKMILNGKYAFAVTVKTPLGNPISGVTVTGLTSMSGESAITDSNGYALGISSSATPTISVASPYVDLQNYSATVASTGPVTSVTAVLAKKATQEIAYTSSASIKFSPDVKDFDACCVGGGGGGGAGQVTGGSGGGGGNTYNLIAHIAKTDGTSYGVTVGAGGAGGSRDPSASYANITYPGSGGTSALSEGGTTILSASGGGGASSYYSGSTAQSPTYPGSSSNGGSGGKGGQPDMSESTAGAPGTTYVFNEASKGLTSGGGGGAGACSSWSNSSGKSGGLPYGGNGANSAGTGQNGKGYGGGGGGGGGISGTPQSASVANGGSGAPGAVIIRWRLKTV